MTSMPKRSIIAGRCAARSGPNRPPLDGLPAYEATGAIQYLHVSAAAKNCAANGSSSRAAVTRRWIGRWR